MKKKMLIMSVMLFAVTAISGCWSCGSYHEAKGTGPVDPSVEHKFFWDKECKPLASEVKEEPKAEPVPCVPCEAVPQHGIIRLEKIMPSQVQVNRPFEYQIKATNMSKSDVYDVRVSEELSSNFEFRGADPEAQKDGDLLKWNIGTINANESKIITVNGIATTAETIDACATVDYVLPSCASIAVVEPMLDVTHTAPDEVIICEDIPLVFTVKNNGTGAAENVTVSANLPQGLRTVDGENKVEIYAGTLAAGETKDFTVNTVAEDTGSYETLAKADAVGLEAESQQLETNVTKPILEITKSGPQTIYLGRSTSYQIDVSNTGDAVAVDTKVEDAIPTNVSDISVSSGGEVTGNTVLWSIGTLAPDASETFEVSYKPTEVGNFTNEATVTAVCADAVTASVDTNIKGIPALLLEVIDIEDPIMVGNNETYVITVTNQGTAIATNIVINTFLEDTMNYVSSSGATNGTYTDAVEFAPLPRLAPGEEATWNVTVEAADAGDVRFTVTMNSDQLERNVQETESTFFYE